MDARLLQYGDVFRVMPHSRIVTDGVVVGGGSEADESMMTGESRPSAKAVGSRVVAGSVNGWGVLEVRATRLPGDNTISAIAGMVDEAKLSKPRVQAAADRAASWFVPVVCVLTLVTFAAWLVAGVASGGGLGAGDAAARAATYAIAVLVVSCPCAVGLAVPMVFVVAAGAGADRGLVLKTAQALEAARDASHVVFDKTGTLTRGALDVVWEVFVGEKYEGRGKEREQGQEQRQGQEQEPEQAQGQRQTAAAEDVRGHILGLVSGSPHPVSAAVARHLQAKGVRPSKITGIESLPGKGVRGIVPDGAVIRVGNARWLGAEAEVEALLPLLSQEKGRGLHSAADGDGNDADDAASLTVFCAEVDGRVAAVFGLRDEVRPEAEAVVSALRRRGLFVAVVSGDGDGPVRSVAARLGIPPSRTSSRCLPEDKRAYVRSLLEETAGVRGGRGRRAKKPVVVFVGDGTNDAPALAAATIGVHMSSSSSPDGAGAVDSAVARSAADVVLIRPDLTGLLVLMSLSRAAMRRVAFNFAWSAIYNVLAILLAAGAFVSTAAGSGGGLQVRIPPAFAGLGEVVSVLPVVLVAVLLRWARLDY